MLWLLKSTVSMRKFFWAPKAYVKTDGYIRKHLQCYAYKMWVNDQISRYMYIDPVLKTVLIQISWLLGSQLIMIHTVLFIACIDYANYWNLACYFKKKKKWGGV